jgi:hypothetical protein
LEPKAKSTATNKVHFVCFDCRKAFKQPESSNWNRAIPVRPFDCPNCKQPMTPLGRYFKAPPQRATRQWLKVELLAHFGEQFWSGNSGLGKKCDTLASTIPYLVESGHDESDVRKRLEFIRRQRGHLSS